MLYSTPIFSDEEIIDVIGVLLIIFCANLADDPSVITLEVSLFQHPVILSLTRSLPNTVSPFDLKYE